MTHPRDTGRAHHRPDPDRTHLAAWAAHSSALAQVSSQFLALHRAQHRETT